MSKKKILEDLFDFGSSKRSVDLSNKITIEFRNISVDGQFVLEESLLELKDKSARYALQKYAVKLLAQTLLSWNGKKFENPTQWEVFLSGQSIALVDRAVKEQQKFEAEIKEALEVEEVEANFSQTGAPEEASKPSSGESTPEKEAVLEKQ